MGLRRGPRRRVALAVSALVIGLLGAVQMGPNVAAVTPTEVTPDIASDAYQTCGIRTDGTVTCWNLTSKPGPPPAGLTGVTGLAGGVFHFCAVKSDTTVVCWGDQVPGTNAPPSGLTGVTQVSADYLNTCALKNDGTVVCWGQYGYQPPAGLTGVVQVASASEWNCALKNDGTVTCWGEPGRGTPPAGLAGVTQIESGLYHTCALKNDGTVICWERAEADITPPADLTGVVQIDSGRSFSCARLADGTVRCWGANFSNQLDVPQTLTDAVDITLGEAHVCALRANGTVVCWGGSASPAGLDLDNRAPTDLALSPSSVAEDQPASTTVGSFSTVDGDTGDTFTYTLVTGAGSTDNARFSISGDQLRTAEVFDYETATSYSIRVRTTDADGASFERTLTVSVTDVNENVAPTATADTYTTPENTTLDIAAPAGVLANDNDTDSLTAILVTGPSHGNLVLNPDGSFAYTPNQNYDGPDDFTYRAFDGKASSATTTVSLTVTATDDAPTVTVVPAGDCADGETVVVRLRLADPDTSADALTVSATSSNSSVVRTSGLRLRGTGADRTLSIRVRSDRGTAVITITVQDGVNATNTTLTVITGKSSKDTLTGTEGADVLLGRDGKDTLLGLGGNDLLCGGSSDDTLFGGAGDDTLDGGRGDDRLSGEAGRDTLTGGRGDDQFRDVETIDTLTDFTPRKGDTRT